MSEIKNEKIENFKSEIKSEFKKEMEMDLKSIQDNVSELKKENEILKNEIKAKQQTFTKSNQNEESESAKEVKSIFHKSAAMKQLISCEIKRSDFQKKSTVGRMDVDTLGGFLFRPEYSLPVDKTIKSNLTKLLDYVNVVSIPFIAGQSSIFNETLYTKNFRSPIERRKILQQSGKRDLSVLFEKAQIQVSPYAVEESEQRQYASNSVLDGVSLIVDTARSSFDYQLAYDILRGNDKHKNIESIEQKIISAGQTIETATSGKIVFNDILNLMKKIPDSVFQNSVMIINTTALLNIAYQETSLEQYKNLDIFNNGEFKSILNNMPIIYIDSVDFEYSANNIVCMIGNFKDSYKLYRSTSGNFVQNHLFDQVNNDRIDFIYEENVGGGFLTPEKVYGLTLKA